MSALKQRIDSLLIEPGCATNQAKSDKARKEGCKKPLTPGAAAGGCAFDGAKIALQPVVDVAHLVHGPIACEGNSWDSRHVYSSGAQTYRTGFTTDMAEFDVIYGGEKRLYRAIGEIIDKVNPPAVFVYQTCLPAMIGDDVEGVCRAASAKFGTPVIPVNAPGFAGSKNLGNKLGGEALLDHVVGTLEPEYTTACDINLIGEYNVVGELWQVKPLFDALGIRVLANFCGDARYRDIAGSHRAKAAIMLCSQALINIARKMQERYDIPFFEGSFYGIADMSDCLRKVSALLVTKGAPADLPARAEALIAREEARAWARLEKYRARLSGKRVLLFTGGVKSWSVVSALQEVGLEIVGTSMRKSTPGDRAKVVEIMGTDAHMFDELPPREMYRMLQESQADVMLSGGRSQFVALKAKTPWVEINQERHHAYAGYDGVVNLVAEIDKALHNPIWSQVRQPAPWEQPEGRGAA
ncbi:nitrogenase iron-molybdenum cofactor biosynthesis protein NifE [Aromatoleum toluclasticum]|uniref:nitrogenase iron-molybdenum cofactor biosynthesis protein NifE n=1 Tax=Aromatoleum toluclasticum TaxID=92003 RepID=UPI001D194468|nr:nitrogenase iron-molybdenum cofactor biosynthesis protein NifE [Aromatoleum toluclasticum]MCC4115124.1 nitrogenase iron-molybdenum cofactor biosynthesis protein NifE [Aromatoleum toluclasticum]